MGSPHQIKGLIVQHHPSVNRIRVIKPDGNVYWTNTFEIIRKDVSKKVGKGLSDNEKQLKFNL